MTIEGESKSPKESRAQLILELKQLVETTDWDIDKRNHAQDLLAKLLSNIEEIKHIASRAEMVETRIAWDNRPINSWSAVLTEASHTVGINKVITASLEYLEELKVLEANKLERLLNLLDQPYQYHTKRGMIFALLSDLLKSGVINPSRDVLGQFVRDSLSQS